jgi:hypothetical protein
MLYERVSSLSFKSTQLHNKVEDAIEHLWRNYTRLISLIDNDIHTWNDRKASMYVHRLSVLLLQSEVHGKQYRKHAMWREKVTRANDLPFERKCHQRWSAEIVYAEVNTTFVTECVSKVSPDFACQCTMCSAFTDKTRICSCLWQKAIALVRDQAEQKPTWSIDLLRCQQRWSIT